MFAVQEAVVMKAIRTLEAVKDQLKFVVELDGKTFGNAKIMPDGAKVKVTPRYKRGETRRYYLPYFKGVKIGDVVQVPFAHFDPTVLAANISAACVHSFGKGNATIFKNMSTKNIEVFIMDMDPSIDPKYRIDLRGAAAEDIE